jgi:hypothetical protein
VDSAEVRILKKRDKVSLRGLLQSKNRRALEAQVVLKVLSNLADEPLERQFAEEQISRLLVPADLAKSHRAGPIPVGLLDAARGGSRLAGSLGGQLLARSFASGRLASCLLGAGHSGTAGELEKRRNNDGSTTRIQKEWHKCAVMAL